MSIDTLAPAHRAAIAELRAQQRHAREAVGLGAPLFREDQLGRALAAATAREAGTRVDPPWAITDSGKRLHAMEQVLWQRTRRILERTVPGPDEDGRILEMIARQAASVEMAMCGELVDGADPPLGPPHPGMADLCSRLLLGTLPTQNPGASARAHGDFYFAQLSAGLLDYAYQVTKVTVQAWPEKPAPKGSMVSFGGRPEEIEAHLDSHPEVLDRLRLTLERYLFHGVPRERDAVPPPGHYAVPAAMITQWNERFVVAHEYAHVLHDAQDIVYPDGGRQGEEFGADVCAFRWLVRSGIHLDRVAPNMATQGAHFVITALEVLRQARDIVRHGQVQPWVADGEHPPPAQRLALLAECHRRWISAEDDDLSIVGALVPVRTLHTLWRRLQADARVAAWRGRTLHPLWDGHL